MKVITLTQNKVTIVDDENYEQLNRFKWVAHKRDKTFYAVRHPFGEGDKLIYMHREIIGIPKNMETDHINGDGLDNRKENLRIVTKRQNQQNQKNRIKQKSSVFPGVCWHPASQKWMTRIQIRGIRKHLGIFENEIDAYTVYRVAEMVLT